MNTVALLYLLLDLLIAGIIIAGVVLFLFWLLDQIKPPFPFAGWVKIAIVVVTFVLITIWFLQSGFLPKA